MITATAIREVLHRLIVALAQAAGATAGSRTRLKRTETLDVASTAPALEVGMPLRPMAERLTRPDWVRRVNLMAAAVGGDGRAIVPIEPDAILEQAEAAVGRPTGDFGDPGWVAKFTALAGAMDAADMHVVGRLLSREELHRAVRTRLLATHALDASPELEDRAVAAPIVITGPARSGTTILFELLALDPTLRAPMPADVLFPTALPEPVPASPEELAECEHELWSDIQPELRSMHDFRSDRPVECGTVTQGSFCGFHWSMIGQFNGAPMDYEVSYDYERRFLQVLQHQAPAATWVLKTPAHITTLPLVFATFPDAWVVQTHRDPAKTIPSTVDLVATMMWLRTDHVDVDTLAVLMSAAFSGAQRLRGPAGDRHGATALHRRALRCAHVGPGGRHRAGLRADGPHPQRRSRGRDRALHRREPARAPRHPRLPAGGLGLHRSRDP